MDINYLENTSTHHSTSEKFTIFGFMFFTAISALFVFGNKIMIEKEWLSAYLDYKSN